MLEVVVVTPSGAVKFPSVSAALDHDIEYLRYPIYSKKSKIDLTYLDSCSGDPWEYLLKIAAPTPAEPPRSKKFRSVAPPPETF